MSLLDKMVAAVMPPETHAARAEARDDAMHAAMPDTWLARVLEHHRAIERAFDDLERADSIASRRAAQKWLAMLLTGHSIAEEVTLYPALASHHGKIRAQLACQEQSAAKGEAAALEELHPMSQDYEDKLAHIRGAIAHHMYEEEGTWFLKLQEIASTETMTRLTRRYDEEFSRYMGQDTRESVLRASGSELH